IEIEQEQVVNSQNVVDGEPVNVEQGLRRSVRMRYELERYGFLVTHTGDVLLMDEDEPTTYQEAMFGPNSEKWLKV
ncbi:hypothetical protein, partial [Escherichia coli]|uniref:hypothetical protein n=1 Tax=Escherichia coli TaxID=562 RepID=UPI003F456554